MSKLALTHTALEEGPPVLPLSVKRVNSKRELTRELKKDGERVFVRNYGDHVLVTTPDWDLAQDLAALFNSQTDCQLAREECRRPKAHCFPVLDQDADEVIARIQSFPG